MSGEILLRGRALTRRWGGLVAVNGVSVELAFDGQHEHLLRTMIEALGAPGCSASTRR